MLQLHIQLLLCAMALNEISHYGRTEATKVQPSYWSTCSCMIILRPIHVEQCKHVEKQYIIYVVSSIVRIFSVENSNLSRYINMYECLLGGCLDLHSCFSRKMTHTQGHKFHLHSRQFKFQFNHILIQSVHFQLQKQMAL